MLQIAVDAGGTFTDFVVCEGKDLKTFKLPSSPKNPAAVIIRGLKKYFRRPFCLIHGTTVATNAFLEGKLAKTAFICTRGFEHILFIGRQDRIDLFNLEITKPPSVIPLNLCIGINERTLNSGKILRGVKKDQIREVISFLKINKIEAAGLVLLHSYKNSKNEDLISSQLQNAGIYLTASCDIMPEYREYERAVVTVLNASLMPVMNKYIKVLQESVKGNKLFIIQSNGGLLSPAMIRNEPIRTLLSGPAGGVIAAKKIAENIKLKNIITLDMGGTSTDVSVIKDGKITLSKSATMNNLPIRIPMIDIKTVGAGGGSIARLDRADVLQVGPWSAGADPGPSCYGKSDIPTVTDAFVVIGAIVAENFLGGKMKIYPQKSFTAIEKLAGKIRKTVYQTAEGIIKIAASSIERALRSITIEKGEDTRIFSLMSFGGAGGLIAVSLAERLGISRIVIPSFGGVFSAFGMLFADYTKENLKSILKPYSESVIHLLNREFGELKNSTLQILEKEGFAKKEIKVTEYIEMRYQGQSYELSVNFDSNFLKEFHKKHRQLYSYALQDKDCEIVNIRLRAVVRRKREDIDLPGQYRKPDKENIPEKKDVFYEGAFLPFNFYQREKMGADTKIKTPAIVMSNDSTVIINNRFTAMIDGYHNIIINKKK